MASNILLLNKSPQCKQLLFFQGELECVAGPLPNPLIVNLFMASELTFSVCGFTCHLACAAL